MRERLKYIIQKLGFSQARLARESGASQSGISEYLGGSLDSVSPKVLDFLASKGVNLNWIFTGEGAESVGPIDNPIAFAANKTIDKDVRKALDGLVRVLEKKSGVKIESQAADDLHAEFREIPELGRIAAGHLTAGELKHGKKIMFPRVLIPDRGPLFMLRVRGESMRDANIHDGDYAILRPVSDPKELSDGAVVAALVDGENTLKRLYRNDGGAILRAANPEFKDIEVKKFQELVIQGHLKYLIKKWHDGE